MRSPSLPHRHPLALVLCLLSGSACGGDDSPTGAGGATAASSTSATTSAASGAGGGAEVPMIGDVLACGVARSTGGMAVGTDLQRHDLDLAVFPDALCNDGTGAVLYFRPYQDEVNRHRWVIQLLGGGVCGTAQECANRWCSVDTPFSMTQMTSSVAPAPGTPANGIFERRVDNPFGDFNHVLVRYCSSDVHAGASRDMVLSANAPDSGQPVTFRAHFLGASILDAVLDTLRAEGVPSPSFTLDGGDTPLPDLDDAEVLIVAGASAGGAGTIRHVDRMAERLRSENPSLVVSALIDSVFMPRLDTLDYGASQLCTQDGICDYDAHLAWDLQNAAYMSRTDESCESWHERNEPNTADRCTDEGHVIRHHVTTPMFVRQGQTDSLLSDTLIAAGFAIPGYGPVDLPGFAELVRTDLAALDDLPTTAEEGSAIVRAPGTFGPSCDKHETLRDTPHTFDVTIDADGSPLSMFETIGHWALGESPSAVITPDGGSDVCPP